MPLPSVDLILKLDSEYREKAAADKLKKIAPKKLNPEGKAWLPIMNADRDGCVWSMREKIRLRLERI